MTDSPELGGVLLLDLAPLVDEVAVLLEEVDALLRVRRDVVVLILQKKKRWDNLLEREQ